MQIINKRIGETPLQALERFRSEMIIKSLYHNEAGQNSEFWKEVPMTYAGRLDPMAEGQLLILVGDECKDKDKYIDLDKEYEVEIVFGISTDTYDALGMVNNSKIKIQNSKLQFKTQNSASSVTSNHQQVIDDQSTTTPFLLSTFYLLLSNYIGKFIQTYPPYSSKTVGGVQLHELARIGELPDELPTKGVEIYDIDYVQSTQSTQDTSLSQLHKMNRSAFISHQDLCHRIFEKIDLIKGDFRQDEIKSRWQEFFDDLMLVDPDYVFPLIKIRVKCSSGTYMRSLADRMGRDTGMGAFALSIKRTKIFLMNENI